MFYTERNQDEALNAISLLKEEKEKYDRQDIILSEREKAENLKIVKILDDIIQKLELQS